MQKLKTILLLTVLVVSSAAHAENTHYQAQINAMKSQWQSGIPVAGAVALQNMRPTPQPGAELAKQLDQALVAARPKSAATPNPESNQL